MNTKVEKAENGLADTKIDAIKNLLFGDNIQEYEAAFERINQRLEEQRNFYDAQLTSLKEENQKATEALQKHFTEQMNNLQKVVTEQLTAAKTDRTMLGDLLIELGKQLKS